MLKAMGMNESWGRLRDRCAILDKLLNLFVSQFLILTMGMIIVSTS